MGEPGPTRPHGVAWYTSYANNVSVFVTSNAEVGKEIRRFEVVTGAKINRKKSVGLQLGSWKGYAFPDPFTWKDRPWFGPDIQLEKNWSEVLERVVAVTEL